jgi:diguanylate cyclase (GGDEF)-like protein
MQSARQQIQRGEQKDVLILASVAGWGYRLELASRSCDARIDSGKGPEQRRIQLGGAAAPRTPWETMLAAAPSVLTDRRSFDFLVERLLPVHRLAEPRRYRLSRALAVHDPESLHLECLAALEDLVQDGEFDEVPANVPSGRCFRRRLAGDRILLVPPRRAAQQASRPTPESTRATLAEPTPDAQARSAPPSPLTENALSDAEAELDAVFALPENPSEAVPPAPETGRPLLGPRLPESWIQLEPFLELASVEAQLEPFGDRLRRIVAQLESSLPGAQVRLLCLDREAADAIGNGCVEVLDKAEADEVPHYREALRAGETQFATSAPVGADPASGRVAAAVPVYVSGEPWGLLRVTWDQGSIASVPELARLLAPLARLVAVAIQNQTMLEKLVFVDPLTGVYNRAFYDRQVALEIERANRTNQKFALLVIDVDDFKPINDRHGHRAGDLVLSQLAREVRARMRKIDLMFRYGGEEFVLLLPGADLDEAQRTAERLRLVVSEQRFLPEGAPSPLRVTVSVGGAVYPDQSRTKTGIFSAADTALYRAKQAGKNRVAF